MSNGFFFYNPSLSGLSEFGRGGTERTWKRRADIRIEELTRNSVRKVLSVMHLGSSSCKSQFLSRQELSRALSLCGINISHVFVPLTLSREILLQYCDYCTSGYSNRICLKMWKVRIKEDNVDSRFL